jgi:hypothetical protein
MLPLSCLCTLQGHTEACSSGWFQHTASHEVCPDNPTKLVLHCPKAIAAAQVPAIDIKQTYLGVALMLSYLRPSPVA